jgi:hypothetical protein
MAGAPHDRTTLAGRGGTLASARHGVIAARSRPGLTGIDLIRRAAPLHDVGKVGVPDGLLRRGGRLSLEETAVMRTHTTIGADILRSDDVRVLQVAEQIAWTHHERWDGQGYPRGLAATDIRSPAASWRWPTRSTRLRTSARIARPARAARRLTRSSATAAPSSILPSSISWCDFLGRAS